MQNNDTVTSPQSGPAEQIEQGTAVVSSKDKACNNTRNEPSNAQVLLDEIDNHNVNETENKSSSKKGGTLSKMFRSIRKDKDSGNNSELNHFEATSNTSNMSLSKLIQKVNPVGKNNRESMSKVLHRIGDAFQKANTNSNEVNAENKVSQSKGTLGRLIQFHNVSKSKASSNTEQKPIIMTGSNLTGNYTQEEKHDSAID